MLLQRVVCRDYQCLYRTLTTAAAAYQSNAIPTHTSPAREAIPKIPDYRNPPSASTALPASSVDTNHHSPPTRVTQHVPGTVQGATTTTTVPPKRARRPRKQVLTLTTEAISRLREIQSSEGKMIKISVVAKGCAGGAYKLEYVDKAERFDEVVEQEDIKVLVDSKSLMKIIGSEMDFQDDVLASRFTFRNPNVVSTCGCEESFATKEDEERILGAGAKF